MKKKTFEKFIPDIAIQKGISNFPKVMSIVEKLKQVKPELERKYPIMSIDVFASYVRCEAEQL